VSRALWSTTWNQGISKEALAVVILSLAGPSVIAGFGEEFGWRGYLLPRLLSDRSRAREVLGIVGIVWGIWHFPVVLGPPLRGILENPSNWTTIIGPTLLSCIQMVGACIALSVIFGALWLRTRSILLLSFFHGYLIGIRDAAGMIIVGRSAIPVLIQVVVLVAAWLIAYRWLERYERQGSQQRRLPTVGNLSRWLSSDNVLVRFAALWALCALLFTAAWTVSYYLLPEGILRGKLLAGRFPVKTPQVTTSFLRIFAANLLVGCGFVTLSNLFRMGEMSLGYFTVMGHSVMYAILLGTNSFGIPAPARFAPSLTTVLQRSGAFEITAYIAIAAATQRLTIWRSRSWLDSHHERVRSWRQWRLNRAEIVMIVGAILLLAAANYREAVQMHQLLG